MVVFGDSDFVANDFIGQGENQDLFMNAVAWSVGEEDQVAISVKEGENGTLSMSALQFALVFLLALLVMPGLAVAGAVVTWVVRRKL